MAENWPETKQAALDMQVYLSTLAYIRDTEEDPPLFLESLLRRSLKGAFMLGIAKRDRASRPSKLRKWIVNPDNHGSDEYVRIANEAETLTRTLLLYVDGRVMKFRERFRLTRMELCEIRKACGEDRDLEGMSMFNQPPEIALMPNCALTEIFSVALFIGDDTQQ